MDSRPLEAIGEVVEWCFGGAAGQCRHKAQQHITGIEIYILAPHIIQRHSGAVLQGSCRPPPRPNTSEAQRGEIIVPGVLKTTF